MNNILGTPGDHLRHLRRTFTRQSEEDIPTNKDGVPVDQPLLLWQYQILDPNGKIVNRWNHVFLVTCLISLFIDPLYFLIPYVGAPGCMTTDNATSVTVTSFRTFFDLFYILHILMKFRTAFVAPNSRVFGRGELVMDAHEIATRYLKTDFMVDFAATLPLPQMVIRWVIPLTKGRAGQASTTLSLIVLIQYVPRLFVIFPLNNKIIKTTGFIAESAWAAAVYNLLLYMLASHVIGASWYVASIGRQQSCWTEMCIQEFNSIPPCLLSFLDCDQQERIERLYWINSTKVIRACDAKTDKDDTDFKFGMFADAFKSEVAQSPFLYKYLYSLWWGLRNLSSYGQNLRTSTYIGETIFCLGLAVSGLVLFARLIGDIQTYLSSLTVRLEEWRIKRRDTEEWMRHRQLPQELQERIRKFNQYKWLATRGVNEESILKSLPLDLRREIQRHLCLNLVRKVPFFAQMDDQLLDAICERLVSSLSTDGSYIVREGEPVNEMLFIIRGHLESSTTHGGFFNTTILGPAAFCGEELLTWALGSTSSANLPASTCSVRTLTEVEAFALRAEDLKFFAHQFKRLHSKKLQHAFRYYSHQWRTWGACFIQTAWRRFKRKRLGMELLLQENAYQGDGEYYEDYDEDSTSRAGNASLVKSTTRGVYRGDVSGPPASLSMPKKLFKPDEPDFS